MNDIATTTISIGYFQELEANAGKWLEKERPYTPKKSGYNIGGYYVVCKCSAIVYADNHINECYCTQCGQKINLEEVDD